jgi:DNA-directed RNA polymerase subunit RPC12/RpoP
MAKGKAGNRDFILWSRAKAEEIPTEKKAEPEPVPFQPALRQIGITECPVCEHEVAVFLTRTNRPFVNCSFCSARIFYNGQESMRLLKKRMRAIEND